LFYKVSVAFHKEFINVNGNEIDIGVMAKPMKGEANAEIIKKIAKHFDVPKSKVRIVAGEKSRKKMVEIT
jgi:uncharacterized protein (TIGR00251 family)